jgi:N-acetyl-anhydromuramyl-L-alanine amidase AmpD
MPSTVKLGSTGSDVTLLQQKLNLLGSKLTVDGDFGAKTHDAVIGFQHAKGLVTDGIVGPNTWAALDAAIAALDPANPPPVSPIPGVEFYDRRKYAKQAHGSEGQWPVTDRPIASVTGVCLHQTACMLGERPERYDSVGAHFAVTRGGKVIWMHDLDRKVAHGNGWNNGTVGIEIDGLYAGVEGDPSTVWDDPSTPSHEQGMALMAVTVSASLALVRWIKQQLGPQMNVIVAHRQSSSSRRNDPGSAIWQSIALRLHTELNCSDGGIGFKLDGGYAIPESWDGRCKGIKY